MKRTLFTLALLTALGAGLFTLVTEEEPAPPPARMVAADNPAVAGAAAPGSTWGRDELRAPPRIVEPPTKPELPRGIVLLANRRELPVPAEETAGPAFGPP